MSDDICYLPATELAEALRTSQLSSREATSAFLTRIDEVSPRVNAVVTLAAMALAEADRADELPASGADLPASGADLPALHGVPMVHNDTHLTKGIRTTFGSSALANSVPDEDELIIARL